MSGGVFVERHIVDKRGRLMFSPEILAAAGIKPGDKATFYVRPDGGIIMKPVRPSRMTRRRAEKF